MSHPNGTPSRRDFLQTSALAAGVTLTTTLSAPAVHAGGSDLIKVGLVGCGGRGSGAVENVLQAAKGVKIVALGDVFKVKTESLRKRLGNVVKSDGRVKELGNSIDIPDDRCYGGLDAFEQVINNPEVNYIILATSPGFRPPHIQAAVASGKTLFTEKPVAVDAPGIRKVLAAYEDAKKKNMGIGAGTQRRHQAGYLATIKRVQDGEIGDIVAARCYWNGTEPWFNKRKEGQSDLAYQIYNWYHFLWLCGDHIVEQHVHNLDVINWALGAHPDRAVGMGGRTHRKVGDPAEVGNIFDHFAIDFEYPKGVHVMSMCRHAPGTQGDVSEALVGTKGTAYTNDGTYKINGKTIFTREQEHEGLDRYVQEHADLIASVREGRPINELQNVAHSTMTAIMGRMATYTGKQLTWEQALNSKEDTMPTNLSMDMSLPVGPVPVPGKTKFA